MRTSLSPFGLVVTPEAGEDVCSLPPALLARWVGQHRLVVLRGFPVVGVEDLADCARAWGPLLRWDFGEVFDVTAVHAVPFHWDGPWAEQTPSYLFFHCPAAPVSGWEMTFCDTTRLLASLSVDELRRWDGVTITYHGGYADCVYSSRLVDVHPITGEPVLRYQEPHDPAAYPIPLLLEFTGVPDAAGLVAELRDRLYDPRFCVTHRWQSGDFLLVDNHALLHRRDPLPVATLPPLHRVHIL
ncbi:TauD/TfdA family dioxygenase [Kutzneria buriramensis]|uniref:Alpha-ketoglutarate-dependent taurine dioxygenase n=1 Tax=Kutzneria buriramensis TaxID=1045776 RepID=A0A3E0GXA2_9PSEU|nr:TauD/TfdA family dioxygenase [Kutzneria buriramensis]REH32462.1 alpha-ketoglutarate-dependent taurine dioxygenase [Kutzneria buriramensis]